MRWVSSARERARTRLTIARQRSPVPPFEVDSAFADTTGRVAVPEQALPRSAHRHAADHAGHAKCGYGNFVRGDARRAAEPETAHRRLHTARHTTAGPDTALSGTGPAATATRCLLASIRLALGWIFLWAVYAAVLIVLALLGAGTTLGLGRWWTATPLVRHNTWLS